MKNQSLFISFIIGIFFLSCSSSDDNDSTETPILNKKYIKSVTKPDLIHINRNHFFEYNQGVLTSAIGWTILEGTYEYSIDGKLINKTTSSGQFSYEYDGQNRIIKEVNLGTNDYKELIYQPGKVLIKTYQEFNNLLLERELILNSEGKIIKVINITQVLISTGFEYQEYEYNSNGNIIKITSKYPNNSTESIRLVSYDDKVNPYYIAFEKYYNLTYYLENSEGLNVYNWYGLTPNNIINNGTEYRVFVYDDENYPLSWVRFFSDGSSNAEAFVEYH